MRVCVCYGRSNKLVAQSCYKTTEQIKEAKYRSNQLVVVHDFNPSHWEEEAGESFFKFEDSLVYRADPEQSRLHRETLSQSPKCWD